MKPSPVPRKYTLLPIMLLALATGCGAPIDEDAFPILTGDYFGQTLPPILTGDYFGQTLPGP